MLKKDLFKIAIYLSLAHWVFALRRISLVAAHGLLIAVASLVAKRRL